MDELKAQVASLETKVSGKEEELRESKCREDVSRAKICHLEQALLDKATTQASRGVV